MQKILPDESFIKQSKLTLTEKRLTCLEKKKQKPKNRKQKKKKKRNSKGIAFRNDRNIKKRAAYFTE